jgi:hypothetical protein
VGVIDGSVGTGGGVGRPWPRAMMGASTRSASAAPAASAPAAGPPRLTAACDPIGRHPPNPLEPRPWAQIIANRTPERKARRMELLASKQAGLTMLGVLPAYSGVTYAALSPPSTRKVAPLT